MESESKRQKYHETQRDLTPEKKNNDRQRNSERHERYFENKKSRTEEINEKSLKRKRSGEGSRHEESRGRSKHYRPSSHDKSHLMKKDSKFDKRRNSRENNDDSGSETNERGKQNTGENSKSYESYDPRTRERSLPKNHRPKQNSQSPTKSSESQNSPSKQAVQRQINEMLSTERHHTKYIDRSSSGEVVCIHWCPKYISPETKGHARGGKSLLHHRCRRCRKLCFHLLGKPGTFRSCLSCSGYKERYIPDWYYHEVCRDCR